MYDDLKSNNSNSCQLSFSCSIVNPHKTMKNTFVARFLEASQPISNILLELHLMRLKSDLQNRPKLSIAAVLHD